MKTRQDLSIVYTPGVARVSMAIAADPAKAFQLTIKRNSVAVVTDGTAVLGLGDIGPLGALPVMEGKAMLFKQFADIDAFPICLDTKDVDEIVETVMRIAPVFGGINLEDICAPRCFEIEERLIEALDIPVMHDDQHGTAVVILAALINAATRRRKAAGRSAGGGRRQRRGRNGDDQDAARRRASRDVIPVDRAGALNRDDRYENPHWRWLAEHCNRENRRGPLARRPRRRRRLHRRLRTGHLAARRHRRAWGAIRSSLQWRTRPPRSCPTSRRRSPRSSPPGAPIFPTR